MRPIVALALASGARRGELLALRLKDLNVDAGTLRVDRSLEQTKGRLRFKSPKTKRGRRTISLPRRSSPGSARTCCANRAPPGARPWPRKGPGSPVCALRWWRALAALAHAKIRAMQALKIEGVTVHLLRHTHASQLIVAGMDVLTILRRLGHGRQPLRWQPMAFRNTDERAAEILEATFARFKP